MFRCSTLSMYRIRLQIQKLEYKFENYFIVSIVVIARSDSDVLIST